MTTPKPAGRRWQAFRELVFATYGRTCHLCGHGGANQADHLIPVIQAPELAWDLANVRPAHGTRNRCPVCGRCCNQSRIQGPKRPYGEPQPVKPRLSLVPPIPPARRRGTVTAAATRHSRAW